MAKKKKDEWGVDIGCVSCIHAFIDLKRLGKCSAFKSGIPYLILSGAQDHLKPLPDQDNDIVFEKIEE